MQKMKLNKDKQSVVVLGHGSRYQEGLTVILQTTERFRMQHPELEVRHAFIELAKPSLEDTVESLIADGFEKITVVPLFLSFGHHIARDLPDRMDKLTAAYPHVELVKTEPIGADPLLCDIIRDRLNLRF